MAIIAWHAGHRLDHPQSCRRTATRRLGTGKAAAAGAVGNRVAVVVGGAVPAVQHARGRDGWAFLPGRSAFGITPAARLSPQERVGAPAAGVWGVLPSQTAN